MAASNALASLMYNYTDSEDEDGLDNDLQENSNSPNGVEQEKIQVALTGSSSSGSSGQLSPDYQDSISDGEEDEYGVVIPPAPTAAYPEELQKKFNMYHSKVVNEDLDLKKYIEQKKEFRNPSIYEKLLQFCDIDEFGTNYSPDIYDPFKWTNKDSYYEELAKAQNVKMAKLHNAEKTKGNVEIISGTAKQPSAATAAVKDSERMKSKENRDVTNILTAAVKKPAAAQQTAKFTSFSTGAKATVRSAFGSLPKRRL